MLVDEVTDPSTVPIYQSYDPFGALFMALVLLRESVDPIGCNSDTVYALGGMLESREVVMANVFETAPCAVFRMPSV